MSRKYWEIIADQLASEGWSFGYVAYQERDFEGWKVDAHKDGQRHQVLADHLNTAFLELQRSIRCVAN